MLRPNELLIHDLTPLDVTHPTDKGRGCIPRDFSVQPHTMFAPPSQAVLIPTSEFPQRIKDRVGAQAQISDVRLRANNGQPIPSLDQNGQGFCWCYSTGHAIIVSRFIANMPYVRLSPHAVACKIKNYQDQGGWGALSAQYAQEHGYPSDQFWPQKSMSRQYDNAATWENASLHKVTSTWEDLTSQVYSRNLTFNLLVSLLLTNVTGPADFNWWGHSVCPLDPVDGNAMKDVYRVESGKLSSSQEYETHWGINNPETRGLGIRIWNSWTDSWSDRGMGVLTGSKAIPDGSMAIRFSTAS